MYPLGHNVSLTSSTGTTRGDGDFVEREQRKALLPAARPALVLIREANIVILCFGLIRRVLVVVHVLLLATYEYWAC